MLIGILDQFDSTTLLIGLGVFFIAQMVFFRYMFGRLNANPADSLESSSDRESEILGDQPIRSAVGTPRPRRLQPTARTLADESAFAGGSERLEKSPVTAAASKPAFGRGDVPGESKDDPYAPFPSPASEKAAPGAQEPVPVPTMTSLIKLDPAPPTIPAASAPAAESTTSAAAGVPPTPAPDAPASQSPADKISLPPISLPPLSMETPAAPAIPAASLVLTPETKPAATPVESAGMLTELKKPVEPPPPAPVASTPAEVAPVTAAPRRFFVNPFAKAEPAPAKTAAQPAEEAKAPASAEGEPSASLPTVEPIGDGIVAVSGPATLADAAVQGTAAEPEESDDVKKRKTPTPPTAAPERTGLILIPPVTGGGDAPAAAPATPAEAVVPGAGKTEPPVGALTLAPAPEAKAEPIPPAPPATKLVGRPRIFLPSNAPVANVAPEDEATEKNPPAAPAGVVESAGGKSDEQPPAVEAKTDAPTGADEAKPAGGPSAGELPPPSVPVDPVAAVPLAAEPPAVPPPLPEAARPGEKDSAPDDSTPPPIPMLPIPASRTAAAPEGSLSLATPAPAHPITTPEPDMPSNEPTTSTSATGRASAQLTLGFEITSLQLTPFFKLGAVQLRPLSNVVSLHLIGTQPENSLAAGISFQIDRVELSGSSIRSIHLKLLGGAQDAATPQPKLQVNSVEFSQSAAGAPISITPSDQTSTAVQLLATFTIAAMDFTPSFEIGSLRLEPTSSQVMLRLSPSSRPAALDLPPAFDIASIQLGGDSQISAIALTPSTVKGA